MELYSSSSQQQQSAAAVKQELGLLLFFCFLLGCVFSCFVLVQVIKSESRVRLTTVTFEFLQGDDDDEFVKVMRESHIEKMDIALVR
jgi:hypothetical protein